ncbi:MAG: dockerin type I domain-containing protein [Planctomycetota bacterium]
MRKPQTLALIVGLALCSGLRAQDFELGFALEGADGIADGRVEAAAGTEVNFTANMTLTSPDVALGAQGWSISVKNNGAELNEVTVQGTVAADVNDDPPGIRNTGFEVTEKVDPARNEGQQGFVSALVLSFIMPITLPTNQVDTIAIATYTATVGDAESTVELKFESGLVGSGQPVENNVTVDGASLLPVQGSSEVVLAPPPPPEDCTTPGDEDGDGDADCADSDCVGIAPCEATEMSCDDGIDNDADGLTDMDDEDCQAPPSGGFDLALTAGETDGSAGSVVLVTAWIQPNNDDIPADGAQGWSLGIEHDGDVLTASDPTTVGTLAADVADGGLRNTGFEKSEVVDPAANDGRNGVVSAVVLSFTMPITLDPAETSSILNVTYTAGDAGIAEAGTTVSFANGLRGAGQPVETVLTVNGQTVEATVQRPVTIVPVVSMDQPFIRGDANDDGKVNIADPIWIINELFRDGPATTCPDTADATDDGLVDLADAMFLIEYRFLAGALPAAPFPDCGLDGTDDDIVCDTGSFASCE